MQNTEEEPTTLGTTAATPAAQARCPASPAAATLHDKIYGFVLQVPTQHRPHAPFMQLLQCHHFRKLPLPFVTIFLRYRVPIITTSLLHHFPSSPLHLVTTSIRHPIPFVIISQNHRTPFITTSLRYYFPKSPHSLRHHFPKLPHPLSSLPFDTTSSLFPKITIPLGHHCPIMWCQVSYRPCYNLFFFGKYFL